MNRTPTPVEFEEFTFSAPSDTTGEPAYLVDLGLHNGDGVCACPDFDIARRKLRKDGETNPDKIQCKHIKRSMIAWAVIQDPMLELKPRREVLQWARTEIRKRVLAKRKREREFRKAQREKQPVKY